MTAKQYVEEATALAKWFFDGWDSEDMRQAYNRLLFTFPNGSCGLSSPGTLVSDALKALKTEGVLLYALITPDTTASRRKLVLELLGSRAEFMRMPAGLHLAFIGDRNECSPSSYEHALGKLLDSLLE
jgi:hypothetical protein